MTGAHGSALLAASYDDVPYRTTSRRGTHPVDMATQARLFGAPAADPATARVLEIGCGDGVNLLAMAASLPGASFVGIDVAAAPVERGRAAAAQLGLANVELHRCDLAQLPDRLAGPYDFVVAHGVYSWVPPDVRDALMALLDRVLAPDGIAFVSYNCYPGSFARDAIRDAVAFALPDGLAPDERVARARGLLRVLAAGREVPSHGEDVARHAAALLERDDWSLFHDELSPWCDAVYLHEFVAHAEGHGLAWLFEARIADGVQLDLPADVRARLEELPDDVVVREQYLDLMRGRMYRESLVRRGPVPAERRLRATAVRDMWASAAGVRDASDRSRFEFASGASVSVEDEDVAAAVDRVLRAWPASASVEQLCEDLTDASAQARLLDVLARLHAVEAVSLRVAPAPTVRAGERPRVARVARWQAASGMSHATSSTHDAVRLHDDLGRRLVALLDGTRDLDALVAELADVPDARAGVEASIEALEALGMFVAYD